MTRTVRRAGAAAATSAAASVEGLASERKTYAGTKKDASHTAFYAGAAKGLASALDGLVLFLSRAELQAELRASLSAAANAQIAYAALAALVVFLLRGEADSWRGVFWSLSRWCRLLTLIVSIFLQRRLGASERMFFRALAVKNPAFADEVRSEVPVKRSITERAQKWKRVAKLAALRAADGVVTWLLPGGSVLISPALKYISIRPTLGPPVALAIAAIHVLPNNLLAMWHFDDLLLSVSEAIVDADQFGKDALRPYVKRLTAEQEEYFKERYRGYITGMGTVYCMLEAIPFMGIPIMLVAECGAACLLEDIVIRNLAKADRISLCGERALQTGSSPRASSTRQQAQ